MNYKIFQSEVIDEFQSPYGDMAHGAFYGKSI